MRHMRQRFETVRFLGSQSLIKSGYLAVTATSPQQKEDSMPSEEMSNVDTLPDGQAHNDAIMDGSAPSEDTAQTKLILGKYKSIEELEKGEAEKEKLFGRQADELGKLRAEAEQLRQRAEMKELLQAVVNNNKTKDSAPSFDADAFTNRLGEKWLEDPKAVAKELLGLNSHWIGESEKKTLSEVELLRQEISKMKQYQADMNERMSPEYQEHKEAIDTMVNEGVPLSVAKSIVKKLASGSPASPEPIIRNRPPASITPTRTITPDVKTPSEFMFDPRKDLAILQREWPDKSEQELLEIAKQMNERRTGRINSGEPTVQKSFKNMTRRG